jgi:pyruvate dehydrogenase E2 component (dihydrolipoamide acetyltransferase)
LALLQGNISEWKKQVGDAVAAGDSLAMIETDKAAMDWESQDDGFLAKILVPQGTEGIKVGTLVRISQPPLASVDQLPCFTCLCHIGC